MESGKAVCFVQAAFSCAGGGPLRGRRSGRPWEQVLHLHEGPGKGSVLPLRLRHGQGAVAQGGFPPGGGLCFLPGGAILPGA